MDSAWWVNGRRYYIIDGKAYIAEEVSVPAESPAGGTFDFGFRPTDLSNVNKSLEAFTSRTGVSVTNPRPISYDGEKGLATYFVPGEEDPAATQAHANLEQVESSGRRPAGHPDDAPPGGLPGAPDPRPMTSPGTGGGGGTADGELPVPPPSLVRPAIPEPPQRTATTQPTTQPVVAPGAINRGPATEPMVSTSGPSASPATHGTTRPATTGPSTRPGTSPTAEPGALPGTSNIPGVGGTPGGRGASANGPLVGTPGALVNQAGSPDGAVDGSGPGGSKSGIGQSSKDSWLQRQFDRLPNWAQATVGFVLSAMKVAAQASVFAVLAIVALPAVIITGVLLLAYGFWAAYKNRSAQDSTRSRWELVKLALADLTGVSDLEAALYDKSLSPGQRGERFATGRIQILLTAFGLEAGAKAIKGRLPDRPILPPP